MQRYEIPRRKVFETKKLQFYRSPLSFKEKARLTPKEKWLKIAGLMLYWAEGGKRSIHVVDFVNCDEKMILLFLKFLRTIYSVRESKLRVFLYCYSDQDPAILVDYWSSMTGIPKNQFTKPYVKAAPNSHVHGKMEHGLVHVRYADMRLFSIIMREIGRLTDQL